MNKTIIININGIVFHIEEDAYEVLRAYMTDVKRHFANEEDSIEITTDIENRIAEMFNETLAREARQVVVTADVTTVISQMGTIEDFETEAEHATSYTDANFSGNRKLFRDPDDHLLGGVCAGVANYFDIDTVWIRLAFFVCLFLGGSGVIAYLILWIIVPRAISRADKMAMKGEKLDLKGFVKNFEEEVKSVHHSLTNANKHGRPFVYTIRDFISDFFDHLKYFLGGAGRILLKLIGVFILLTCFGFIVTAAIGLGFILAAGRDVFHLFPFSIVNDRYNVIYFSAFAVAAIPLLSIILLTLRVIFGSKVLGRSTSYTLLIVWIVALSLLGYYSSKVLSDFKESAAFSQSVEVKAQWGNTYYLKMNDIKYLSKEDSLQLDINDKFKNTIILNEDNDDEDFNRHESRPQSVRIYIERSDVGVPTLVESFSARGFSYQEALRNARNSSYFFSQKDSVLTFDRTLKIPHNALWRDQEVKLTLKIPQNATVVIDPKLDRYVENLSVWECNNQNNRKDGAPATFTMTGSGLECKIDTTKAVVAQPEQ